MRNYDLSLLILSCDKYSDLWDPFYDQLEKNWNDRAIKSYILTDKKTGKNYENVEIISAGKNLSFSERIRYACNEINSKYVFITLDDYFLMNKIDNSEINKILNYIKRNDVDYFRIFPIPKPNKKGFKREGYYNIDLSGNYKVNLYPGIWKRELLSKTVKEELNPWEYEVSLTKVARENNAVCCMSTGTEFPILDVIRKGKILNKAYYKLRKESIFLSKRNRISLLKEVKLDFLFYGKEIIPNFIWKKLKFMLIKFGFSFYSELD